MSVKLLFVTLLLCLCALSQARPMWGPTGHALIASIAQTLLSTESTQQALTLLPANQGQLAQIASWADQIKDEPQWSWSAPLHYINTPNWECNFNPSTDCPNQVCVAGAIFNYTNQLANPGGATFNATQDALKFVVHFVGDIHQPLHVAFASDEGGNTIDGTYFGYKDNLHEVWDTYLINTRMSQNFSGSQTEYLNYLVHAMNTTYQAYSEEWSICNNTQNSPYACPDEWGAETANKACLYAYTDNNGNHIQSGFKLGQDYFDFVQTTLDEQLIKGGIRLARTLNNIWGSK